MNSTLCRSNDTIFDEVLLTEEYAGVDNSYATEAMPAIKKVVYHQPDEEELHTSFEEAISDRIVALHTRLNRLSNPVLNAQYAERNTDALLSTGAATRNTTGARKAVQITHIKERVEYVSRPMAAWRNVTLFVCSAIMFLLFGFDLMGLIVLHMH